MNRLHEHYSIYGAGPLSTADLLALLLSHHNRPVSARTVTAIARLLDAYGMRGLRQVGEHDLVAKGLTSTQAHTLKVVCDLAARFSLPDDEKPLIATVTDAVALLRPFMESLDHEEFRVLVLDTKNQVVAHLLLYQGTVNCCPLRAAEIFRHAIIRNSPRVIVCHNHPSGDSTPSAVIWRKICQEEVYLVR